MHLSAAEHTVLDEALRRGESLRETLQSTTLDYGRWLLDRVFDGDTTSALDDRSRNPIWLELVRRAGGPTLGISRHLMYVALRIAANDRRINALAWRNLDVGRKELLLPLGDERLLLSAAKHVSDLNLSQPKTREYVSALRASAGKPRLVRITPRALAARVKKLRTGLGGAATARKLQAMRGEMDPKDRDAIAAELTALRDAVTEMLRAMRGR